MSAFAAIGDSRTASKARNVLFVLVIGLSPDRCLLGIRIVVLQAPTKTNEIKAFLRHEPRQVNITVH